MHSHSSHRSIFRRSWARIVRWHYAFNRFVAHAQPVISRFVTLMSVATFVAAFVTIVSLVVLVGFEHDHARSLLLLRCVKGARIVFIIAVLFNLVFNFNKTRRNTRLVKWILDITILVTVLPLLYPQPDNPWIPFLADILYSKKIMLAITGIYAVWEVSYGITRMLGRRVNPSLLLACSFIFFILIGSLMLMMPKCTYDGISYTDSLFVSTSAVCITGLSTVDVATTFTPFGILILSLMIQIGGLGVMTFTSFFALFFSGNTSIYSQLMVKDMVNSKSINSLLPTLLYILGFTLVIELMGAALILVSVHGTLGMSLEDELIFSGFHSLSAFCNAGFSNIEGGMANEALLLHNQSIYLIASGLIFLGGVGFPILENFKTAFFQYLRRIWARMRGRRYRQGVVHIYNINTKLVMSMTLGLFVLSTIAFFVLEYNNSLAGMSLGDKVVQSVFNAWSPRSSGFVSLNPAGFMTTTILMIMVMMWIGGGSQSTAGGIKVNTFGVIMLELKAVIFGRKSVDAYGRSVAHESVRRAFAVVTLSIVAYSLYSFVLVALEPGLPVKALLFESASALFTVGSSLGITEQLSEPSKILLCSAMFVGRVGLLSLLMGLVKQRRERPIKYPEDNIIIN